MPVPAPSPAERFAEIVAILLAMVGARLVRPGKPGAVGQPTLALAIALRLQRMRNRIASICARWQAGTLRPPRRRPAAPHRRTTAAAPGGSPPKLPHGRLWLVRLVPGSSVGANYLRILLDDPEMQALIQAAPQIGRTLRPFWHMLSPDPLPPILQPPRPAPPLEAPRPAAPPNPPRAEPARPHCTPLPAPEGAARAPLSSSFRIA